MVQVRTTLKALCLSVHPDDIKNCTSVNIFKKCLKNISYHTIRPQCIVTNQLFIQPFSKSIIL